MRRLGTLIGFSLLFLLSALPGSVNAAEQRCNELGANCVCSEPFNTNFYTHSIMSNQWNPADSTTKECSQELANHPIARNIQDIVGTNNATILNAFPAGHSVSYVLRAGDGNVGIWWIGNGLGNDCGSGWERCEFRWYVYKSTDFVYYNPGVCTGDKHAEIKFASGPDSIINVAGLASGDGMAIYNFLPGSGWTPALDCCNQGPRVLATDTYLNGALQRGKWFRFSHVIRNPAGGTGASRFHFEIYAKNVTDNTPEVKILDLEGTGTPGWNGPYSTVNPPGRAKTVAVNGYREGTCAGFEAYSHLLIAHWATDAGQRIGPAYEIEGTTSSTPSTPPNVRVK